MFGTGQALVTESNKAEMAFLKLTNGTQFQYFTGSRQLAYVQIPYPSGFAVLKYQSGEINLLARLLGK